MNENAGWYICNILEEHLLPYIVFIGYHNFVLIHDNAPAHATRTVTQYLKDVGMAALEWLPNSPDANPIEHLWDMLKRNVWAPNRAPNSIAELRIAAQDEWNRISQETINDLLRNMSRRI